MTSADATRERLIAAGLTLFAEHGLTGVRTRTLAQRAEVNQSAIPYHFGGKEGVYAAVIDHLVSELSGATGLPGDAQIAEVMERFTRAILGGAQARARILLIAREQLNPTTHYDRLFTGFVEPTHRRICALVADASAAGADDQITVIRAHAVIGQALGFAVAQTTYLRRVGRVRLSPQEIDVIARVVGEMSGKALQ
ncbi:TetR family transcriptional regulator [Mycobacteroides immunogenum]|uniref:TetR family transcriptional regulator n=1 Tax=Mycobacteroides immunogenum TaxID=83262 RepID=A0A179VEU8_9MYCO|nr:CerR family C-terminal domain-containing protein [Mycobacteroides immunogenum]OAT69515.1 TetR family transcriptional regulator [Mycobacteroides immunogenum]